MVQRKTTLWEIIGTETIQAKKPGGGFISVPYGTDKKLSYSLG